MSAIIRREKLKADRLFTTFSNAFIEDTQNQEILGDISWLNLLSEGFKIT